MTLPPCEYCETPNARIHAVGRRNLCFCDEWCYRRWLIEAGPPPFWAHVPGLRWFLKFFLLMALVGCGGEPIYPIASTCAAIVDGEPSSDERSTVNVSGYCTGVYIADGVVLTAAHCGNPAYAAAGGVVRSNVFYVPHPEYDRDGLRYDLALVFLDGPLPLPIAPIGPAREGPALVQGYGNDEDENRGRLRERPVEVLGQTSWGAIATTAGSCFGDSGGPLYQDGAVVALVKNGASNDCQETTGYYTPLDQHIDWIKSEADATFANGC